MLPYFHGVSSFLLLGFWGGGFVPPFFIFPLLLSFMSALCMLNISPLSMYDLHIFSPFTKRCFYLNESLSQGRCFLFVVIPFGFGFILFYFLLLLSLSKQSDL